MSNTYTNPVLKGFFPDPSVIRVGEDYYVANSTFQYFPAVVISHSPDLVHWRQIGHAVTNPGDLDLVNLDDSRGIWAPDIAYYDGTFYIDEAGGEYSVTQEGVPRMCRHKAFTGTMVGIYANNGETGAIVPADFDWFRYQGKEMA